jgi:hypothetical protein
MPTDLEALFARKRKARWEKNKESQAVLTMLSVSVIISLVVLVLVFADKSYAQAMGELMDLEELMDLF